MISAEDIRFYGDLSAACMFIQMEGNVDEDHMESEKKQLRRLSGRKDWCIAAVPVTQWNRDLSPWEAAPVFGDEGFGSGAAETLQQLLQEILPRIREQHPCPDRKFIISGYSLAGLFALYAGIQTDAFSGVIAASPSVWFPGWLSFSETHPMQAGQVYASLGLKEEKTRNPVMSAVGDAIRGQYRILADQGVRVTLEWNPGNHFIESDLRVAKGMHWMLQTLTGLDQS